MDAAGASSAERLFFAAVADRVAAVFQAAARIREQVLAAACASESLTVGESTEAGLAELARAHREAEQALRIGIRHHRRHTQFAEIGASAILELLETPQAAAFAASLAAPAVGAAPLPAEQPAKKKELVILS